MLRLLTILEKIVFETSAVSLSLSIIFSILASMIFPFGLIRKKKVSPVTKRFVVSNFLFIDVTLFYYMTPFDFCQRLNVFTFETYSSLSLFWTCSSFRKPYFKGVWVIRPPVHDPHIQSLAPISPHKSFNQLSSALKSSHYDQQHITFNGSLVIWNNVDSLMYMFERNCSLV